MKLLDIQSKKKLAIYGVCGKNLEWFKSYLRNRKQYVQIDDENKTDFLSVTYGVPQVSILGPLLFIFSLFCHQMKAK